MTQNQPNPISLPPEAEGYIQGLKDIATVQTEMIAQRTAEIFGLRRQLGEALARISAADETFRDAGNSVSE